MRARSARRARRDRAGRRAARRDRERASRGSTSSTTTGCSASPADASTAEIRRAYLDAATPLSPGRAGARRPRRASCARRPARSSPRSAARRPRLTDPARRRAYDAALGSDESDLDAERLAAAETNYRKGEILSRQGNFRGALDYLRAAAELLARGGRLPGRARLDAVQEDAVRARAGARASGARLRARAAARADAVWLWHRAEGARRDGRRVDAAREGARARSRTCASSRLRAAAARGARHFPRAPNVAFVPSPDSISPPSPFLLEHLDALAQAARARTGRSISPAARDATRSRSPRAASRSSASIAIADACASSSARPRRDALADPRRCAPISKLRASLPLAPAGCGALLVFRYLHRPLAPALAESLRPGGLLLYETFTIRSKKAGLRARRIQRFCSSPASCPGSFRRSRCCRFWEGVTQGRAARARAPGRAAPARRAG